MTIVDALLRSCLGNDFSHEAIVGYSIGMVFNISRLYIGKDAKLRQIVFTDLVAREDVLERAEGLSLVPHLVY